MKGALGPGEMIAVDLDGDGIGNDGAGGPRFYTDREIKDRIAGAHDYAAMVAGFTTFASMKGHDGAQPGRALQP